MTKREKFLVVIVILQTLAIAALIATIVCIRFFLKDELQNNLENFIPAEEETTETEKADLSLEVSANLVWWDQDNGVESIENNSKYISSISPFWYELTSSGEVETFSGAEDDDVIQLLKESNIQITPVISNEFERQPLASILQDETKTNQHIEDLLTVADKYDGISLNYENLNLEDKDNFTNFVGKLSERLKENNKTLEVHLHAKTDEPGTWNGPQAQDWEALGKVCDKLKVMAYDYHWSTSEPGDIALSSWVEEVILHAKELIPEEKILLGIPLYGYDWVEVSQDSYEGEGVTYKQAVEISQNFSVNVETSDSTPHFVYTDSEGLAHEVWYENSLSVKAKLELANKYNLGGIDFWRLGDEDPNVWQEIENVLGD